MMMFRSYLYRKRDHFEGFTNFHTPLYNSMSCHSLLLTCSKADPFFLKKKKKRPLIGLLVSLHWGQTKLAWLGLTVHFMPPRHMAKWQRERVYLLCSHVQAEAVGSENELWIFLHSKALRCALCRIPGHVYQVTSFIVSLICTHIQYVINNKRPYWCNLSFSNARYLPLNCISKGKTKGQCMRSCWNRLLHFEGKPVKTKLVHLWKPQIIFCRL